MARQRISLTLNCLIIYDHNIIQSNLLLLEYLIFKFNAREFEENIIYKYNLDFALNHSI